MKYQLNDDMPIYIQIKKYIEDSIIEGKIKEGERVPSTNEFAKFYNINPATAAKGVNELVQENILKKRRGVGMFVKEGARQHLIAARREEFVEEYILPLKREAEHLNITKQQLIEMIEKEKIEE